MKYLILLSSLTPDLTAEEQRILKFAQWMGIATKTISIDRGSTRPWQSITEPDVPGCCVAMSAETLALLHEISPHRLEHFIHDHCTGVLVFDCAEPPRHGRVLSWLTSGAVRGVNASVHRENMVELPDNGREFSRQLAGLSFSTDRCLAVPTFDRPVDTAAARAIMLVNSEPVFIRTTMAACEIFLLAGSAVPDIDAPLSRRTGIEAYYDQLIPFLVFLRRSFGSACWHGPESTARLIIDDPLLAERYGFLDYRALLSSMDRERYGTSIAFIPWNYRRTSSRTASSLFAGRPDFSICVHGCDHTNKEFDDADQTLLEWKAGVALDRMERHQTRTNLSFERVMVFPQGRFSSDAMLALRAANYLAAVNSTCFPTDERLGPLTIGDFLRPAITRFHGFPIFQRRYPRRLVDSAFDMFLGKPALLVEHSQYFREGCEKLEEFVTGLRGLEPTLTWPSLSAQFMRSCITRVVSPESVEVEFFTKRFLLKNPDPDRRRFRLVKHEPDSSVIRGVLVDKISTAFSVENNSVSVELEADPGQAREIEVLDAPRPSGGARRMGVKYSVGVFVRRSLSEFRDNQLVRHPRLLHAATGLVRGLKVAGESQDRTRSRRTSIS